MPNEGLLEKWPFESLEEEEVEGGLFPLIPVEAVAVAVVFFLYCPALVVVVVVELPFFLRFQEAGEVGEVVVGEGLRVGGSGGGVGARRWDGRVWDGGAPPGPGARTPPTLPSRPPRPRPTPT